MTKTLHAKTNADSVMSIAHRILTVVDREMTVDELAVFLLEHQLSAAVVVGPVGAVLGFVSMTDLVREHVLESDTSDGDPPPKRHRHKRSVELVISPRTLVRDIMMPFVLTLPEGCDVPHAAAMMASRDVHQLLIRSETGAIIAVVHARDVLAWFARSRGLVIPDDERGEWRKNCLFAM